ncbi:hypothetical protein, partial [endosymbiont of Lamellibrachia barhami]|uniref:hypothetical protein n=1 Tax=endosymbiont of Lamellibrachia barhami TaxID=205975 RepID=UPI001C4B99FC
LVAAVQLLFINDRLPHSDDPNRRVLPRNFSPFQVGIISYCFSHKSRWRWTILQASDIIDASRISSTPCPTI